MSPLALCSSISDATLDLADVVEIEIEAAAIARIETLSEPRKVLDDHVENAAVDTLAGDALLGRGAVAEEALEHRRGGPAPSAAAWWATPNEIVSA